MQPKPGLMRTQYGRDGQIEEIVMPLPSNFHAHLREGFLMRAIARAIMWWVKYLLVMPNTGPIDTIEKVIAYHNKLKVLASSFGLKPTLIMTIYWTGALTPQTIEQLARLPFRIAVKYYPPHPGATTGSGKGVPLSYGKETLRAMAAYRIPLLGHFETVIDAGGRELPHAEREGYFMTHEFPRLREENPELHINIEHGSTALAVQRVREDSSGQTTIGFTPHHLLLTIEELMRRSWRNHGRCMPIPKSADDLAACVEFATSGDRRAHAGDDTAPHLSRTKQGPFDTAACGCWLPHSLALYAKAFAQAGALDDRFVQFMCYNGPDIWGLPRPGADETIRIRRETANDIPDPTQVPEEKDVVVPLGWTLKNDPLGVGYAAF